ncbi:WD-40 repeat-containing protein [Scytonema sp. HK-05]|uniref:nSTAND1 domain-containing NTPase n=1 Tax=Scytonema sp. HK-05 TaxID=1137095 RepID=UPI000B2AE18C|nr:hypothetical protein [Scytonema sp. HK-05]BAY48349.1 WD-40 repeat-containing protein [Scytonema sp. HK-05]
MTEEDRSVKLGGSADSSVIIPGNSNTATITITNYYYRENTTLLPSEYIDSADENFLCPYRGLFHFGPDDAEFFFGREVFVEELFVATQTSHFIPVLGASGSGKSSVVLAGLVPKLQQAGHWLFTHFRPGSDPFHALALALVPLYTPYFNATEQIAQARQLAGYFREGTVTLANVFAQIHQNHGNHRVLLIADQFEELYTLCGDQKVRLGFLDTLLACFQSSPDNTTVLVATMRADFLGNFLSYRPLVDVLQNADIKLGPMNCEELSQVIKKPAEKLGVTFEAGLVERILEDVEDEPGNLPLLEFALTQLWKGRRGKQLTHAAYEEIGEVQGALARHADQNYGKLSATEKEQVKRIFIQLVRPGEGTEDTRRLATKAELSGASWALVNQLADARLVVTSRNAAGQETVEVVHEALIHNWGELRGWMGMARSFRAWQERLRAAKRQWEATNRDPGSLLRGAALAEAEEKLKERPEELIDEKEFIEQSIQEGDRQEKEKEAARQRELAQAQELAAEQSRRAEVERQRAQEQTKATRKLRRLVVGLVVVFLGAAGTGVFAMIQTGEAQRLRFGSIVQALAGQAPRQPEQLKQDERGALLARQAYLFNQRNQNQVLYQANVNDALRAVLGFRYFSAVLRDHTDRVWSVAFSPDGHTMASGSLDGTVRVWNLLQPGTKPIVLRGHENWVTSVAFSPDGQMLVSGGDDKTVRLWDLRQPSAKPTIFNHKDRIWSVAFSSDGHTIASGSEDKTVSLWDLRQPSPKPIVLNGHEDIVRSLAFSSDGHTLASGSDDKTVRLWDLRQPSAKPIVLTGHSKAVSSVAFSRDDQMLASGSQDNTVRLWNLRQPNSIPTVLNGHEDIVRSVAFSSDGQMLASGSDDKTVRLWDLHQPSAKPTVLTGYLEAVSSVAFSRDSQMLASGSDDKTVRLWDLRQPSAAPTILTQKDSVSSVAFSSDSTLASGSQSRYWKDHNVQLWNLRQPSAKPIVLTIPNSAGIYSVAFSPDGQILASSAESMDEGKGGVQLWNLGQPGSKPTVLSEARGYSLVFSPDGHTLASAGYKKIQIWNLRQLETKPLVLEGHENYVTSVAFSPDGDTLASGSNDNTVRVWNLRQPNAAPIILRGHEQHITSVAFSPDGHTIASGSQDKTVRLWNLRQPNAAPIILSGHQDKVRSVAFSRDGHTLASSSNDQTVRLWDLRQPNAVPTILRAVLRSPTDGFSSVAFSSNGQSLASGSDDGTIRIWNIRTEALADKVCEKVWRNLTLEEWRRFVGEGIPYERTCGNLPADSETSNNNKPRSAPAEKLVTPVQMFPANKTIFKYLPRVGTLRWSDVPGATSYTVEIEFCQPGGCTANNAPWIQASNLQSTSYTFDFVGAQPGRWRVWAVDAAGRESPKSGWWEFQFTR